METTGARVRECVSAVRARTSVEVEAGLPDEEQALLFPTLSELRLRFMVSFLTVRSSMSGACIPTDAFQVRDNRQYVVLLAHFRRRLKAETLDGWDG
jgi:hypothetical protein